MAEMIKPKIHWVTKPFDAHGNALGYQSHNGAMYRETAKWVDYDDNAKIALHIVSADKFQPIEGKINVLFTMWEFPDVPPLYQEAIAKADFVIVPSSFCRDIFAQFSKNRPIICWEGVDPSLFTFVQRTANMAKFRFLWVGAPNPRKGYQSILNIIKMADHNPKIEFYLKTTVKRIRFIDVLNGVRRNWRSIIDTGENNPLISIWRILKRIPSAYNAEKVFCYGKNKNIFVDTRKISTQELVGLYHSSHCFLFPTLGEGWGLTLCEAMATGLPCIAVDETGCKDFFDNTAGYIIKNELKSIGALPNYNMADCRAYIPDTKDLFEKILMVLQNYDLALRKGKRASERIRTGFTWEKSGERLGKILGDIYEKVSVNSDIDAVSISR